MADAGLLYPLPRTLLRRNIRHKVAAAEFTEDKRACRGPVTVGRLRSDLGWRPGGVQQPLDVFAERAVGEDGVPPG